MYPATSLHSCVVVAVALSIGGCSRAPGVPSDPKAFAEQTLARALDTWKASGTVEDLQREDPAIVVGDLDWKKGARLVDYRLSPAGTFDGRNLRMPVALVVRPPHGGREYRINTSYIVGIEPVVTVIREAE